MTKTFAQALALTLALATGATLVSGQAAHAGAGKDYYSQSYFTKKAMHGFEGRAGDYYCSYIRKPVHKIVNGRMKVVGWELQQHCY